MNPAREEVLFALGLEKPAEERAAGLDCGGGGDELHASVSKPCCPGTS